MPLAKVIAERPDVFNHNVEVVPRLYPVARRGSRWERSLRVLRNAKEMGGDEVVTKSGLMVGLGETHDEMVEAFGALREHGVQVLTVGQYLRPTERHLPVVRFWHPDEFKALEDAAYALGFDHIAAGPLVRSSYHADEHVPQSQPGQRPARRRRRLTLFPLKDNIPTDRFPVVTVALIVANVLMYLFFQKAIGSPWLNTPDERQHHRLRRVPVRVHPPGRPLRGGQGGAIACEGMPGVTGTADPQPRDLADRLHLDVHARQPAPPRRQHAVPVDLRQQRRGLDGPA